MKKVKMFGAEWCPDCQRAKSFLEEHDMDYEYYDIEVDETNVRRVEKINDGKRIIPTFIIGGQTFTNPFYKMPYHNT